MSFLLSALPVLVGVLSGAVVALQFIAPKTKTTVDDSVLTRLEQLESILNQALPYLPDAVKAAMTPVSSPAPASITPPVPGASTK